MYAYICTYIHIYEYIINCIIESRGKIEISIACACDELFQRSTRVQSVDLVWSRK